MEKKMKLALLGGGVLAVLIAGYSYVQVGEARRQQELDKLINTLATVSSRGAAAAKACATLLPSVQARLPELEARDSGDQLWRIYRGIADCTLHSGNPDAAIPFYEKIITAKPQEGRGHGDLAWALSKAGRHAEALRSAQLAVQLSPAAWQAHRMLGRVQSAAGQTEAAIASLDKARSMAPPAEQAAAEQVIANLRAKLASAPAQAEPVSTTPLEPGKPLPLLDKP